MILKSRLEGENVWGKEFRSSGEEGGSQERKCDIR